MKEYIVEICCGSADDVLEAAKAGAHRVELNSNLFQGGLTPTVGTLRTVKRHSDIPAMCMVRPREGGFHYTEAEYETMLEDAAVLLENGADGIVFGFLDSDGRVDRQRCERMMEVIGGKCAVFHRAIDVVPDWREALDALIDLGVTRVLTSGQKSSVYMGAKTVREMIGYAAGRIEILPGAGITLDNAREILEMTGADQMHLAMLKPCYDRSTLHNTEIYFGGMLFPPEDRYQMTDCSAVRQLREVIQR